MENSGLNSFRNNEVEAPFTDEQVKALNAFQDAGRFHPFTCLNDGDEAHIAYEFEKANPGKNYNEHYKDYIKQEKEKGVNYPEAVFTETNLVATNDGWICPVCDYKQKWAHGFMTVPDPRDAKKDDSTEV